MMLSSCPWMFFCFFPPLFLNLTFSRGILFGCWDAERRSTHWLLCTHSPDLTFWACVQSKEEPGMTLHRLGRCVIRNMGGIMSGTMEDMVQSVTSLKSTRERITSLCCEKIVFSPLWDQLLNWNQLSTHQMTIWIEDLFPLFDLHTWPPANDANFLSTTMFDSLLLWFLFVFTLAPSRALLQEDILPIWSRKFKANSNTWQEMVLWFKQPF